MPKSHMKALNYKPWDLKISDFPENNDLRAQIIFLLRFAILAPSGHNSQPWEFQVKENNIFILVNKERSLAYSDPKRRQLLVGIGCLVENFLIAADYYGFRSEIKYFPEASNDDVIAQISLKKIENTKNSPNHLIFSIAKRRTNRGKYESRLIPEQFLQIAQKNFDNNTGIDFVTDKNKKDEITNIVSMAQVESMDDPLFREELSHYIKSNFTKAKTGMPGFTLGIPGPVSPFASLLIKKVNLSKKSQKQDEALLREFTPTLCIISSREDNKNGYIASGRLFERTWLLAEQAGIAVSPLAAVIQRDNHCAELQKVSGVRYRPQVFFRMGYPLKFVGHSPRMLIGEVMRT
ncbi:MAG: hypothetical protein Q7R65_01865 [bacterium]|nr:hypothetical protein [bacterium]